MELKAYGVIKLTGAIIVIAFAFLGFAGFILAIGNINVSADENADMKVALECELYEDFASIIDMIYDTSCNSTDATELCKTIKEDIEHYEQYAKVFKDTYDVEQCLDIWP